MPASTARCNGSKSTHPEGRHTAAHEIEERELYPQTLGPNDRHLAGLFDNVAVALALPDTAASDLAVAGVADLFAAVDMTVAAAPDAARAAPQTLKVVVAARQSPVNSHLAATSATRVCHRERQWPAFCRGRCVSHFGTAMVNLTINT